MSPTTTPWGWRSRLANQNSPTSKKGAIIAKVSYPAGLVVVSQQGGDDDFRARKDYASIACAIENIQLAAHAESLGPKEHEDIHA
jgi:hypothetical protein